MPSMKRIVCLANSRKLSGRCIAGKEWQDNRPGKWIRPVSARDSEEISEYERQYEDGSDPRVLDIMAVPLLSHRPRDHQQENWLIDAECCWVKQGVLSWDDLGKLVDSVAPLWNDGHRTNSGCNDKVPLASATSLDNSLRLIHVDRVQVSVFKPGEAFGNPRRRVQAQFSYAERRYALWITDPFYERLYLAKTDGVYEIGENLLTISLGEEFRGAYYKLVAAVIQPDSPVSS